MNSDYRQSLLVLGSREIPEDAKPESDDSFHHIFPLIGSSQQIMVRPWFVSTVLPDNNGLGYMVLGYMVVPK